MLKEGELYVNSVVKNYYSTASDGKKCSFTFYSLPEDIAESKRQRKTKYYYQDIAISLIGQRETDLIKFALKRWKLENESFNRLIKVYTFKALEERKNVNNLLKDRENKQNCKFYITIYYKKKLTSPIEVKIKNETICILPIVTND